MLRKSKKALLKNEIRSYFSKRDDAATRHAVKVAEAKNRGIQKSMRG